MDVAITELRANLSIWLDQARSGHEVVITDRGVPVARLLGLTTTATLERLTAEGVISGPGPLSAQQQRGGLGPGRAGPCLTSSAKIGADRCRWCTSIPAPS